MRKKFNRHPGRGPGPRRGIPHTLALPDQIRPRQSGDAAVPNTRSFAKPRSARICPPAPLRRHCPTSFTLKPPPAHSGALPTRHHYSRGAANITITPRSAAAIMRNASDAATPKSSRRQCNISARGFSTCTRTRVGIEASKVPRTNAKCRSWAIRSLISHQ